LLFARMMKMERMHRQIVVQFRKIIKLSYMGCLHFGFDAGKIDSGSIVELAATESGIVVSERSCDPLHGHDCIVWGECPVSDE